MIRKEKTLRNIAAMAGILLVSQWNGSLSYGQSAPDASGAGKETSTQSVAASSVIYGTIFSSKDKKPLASVPVALKNNGTGQVITKKTDAQGAFIFSHLVPGNYQIIAGGGSFSLQKKEGILKGSTVGEMNFQVLPLSTGNSVLSGNIYEGHGDNRIPLAAQMAVKNSTTGEIYTVSSDPSGVFVLPKIPAGQYTVQVMKKGYLPLSEEVAVNGKTGHDFRLSLNKLSMADINANASKKIKDTTGAITIIGKKKFEDNQSAGVGFVLNMAPSVNYYSRSGMNGLTGGMNYFQCRGYSTGGGSNTPVGGSNIEFTVEGVPMNVNQDGGMVYDLNLMNSDIASVDILRGVTTSQNLGNYASGCSVNIHLVQPTSDPFTEITGGAGSYGLLYSSLIQNTGLIGRTNTAAYNNFSIINNNGFQIDTSYQEYQDYANVTKYLGNGYIKLMFTGAYKNYDRGSSISTQDFNTFGPTYNGAPNFNSNSGAANGVYAPNSPYYHNWVSQRYMVTVKSKNKIADWLTIKNNAFVWATPYGVNNVPVALQNASGTTNGVYTGTGNASGAYFNDVAPQFGGAANPCGGSGQAICMNPFAFQYTQGEGYKAGDILQADIDLTKSESVHIGARASYSASNYGNNPIDSSNIAGSANSLGAELSTIGVYAENQWDPIESIHTVVGFREMFLGVQNTQNLSGAQYNVLVQANNNGLFGNQNMLGGTAGQHFALFMPHAGIDLYPTKKWKIYANIGESYSAPATQFYQGVMAGTQAPNVPVETLWDYGVGTRYDFEKGYVALDTYYDNVSNETVFSYVPTAGTGSVMDLVPTTASAITYEGFEIDGAYAIGYGFSTDANFSMTQATYNNYSVSGVNFSGERVPFIPASIGNIDLNYAKGNWHATVNERFTGNMNVIDTGTAVQLNSPSYWVTNLMMTYDLPKSTWYKKASLFFDAYNLLNTNYYNPAGVTQGANSMETLFVYPGEPINVFGGVSVTF